MVTLSSMNRILWQNIDQTSILIKRFNSIKFIIIIIF